MASPIAALKHVLIGRPMSSGELGHTLLPKSLALPVFSSDPLSSNAYASQEAMLVLGLAGAGALRFLVPISIAVATVLAVVVFSYRQTVHAYPGGGGAYRVSKENLGIKAGLLAASALLGDYVLTVAVSMTAGVDAIASAFPSLERHVVSLAVGSVVLITMANLRGVRESGTFFAIPTYGFVALIFVMLGTGLVKCLDGCPLAPSAGLQIEAHQTLSFFLILKAFAAGTTALTGVEAIADGTAAFRYPQSKNAATTLSVMGALTITMFLGISWLGHQTQVVFVEGSAQTVVAQVGEAVFGRGTLYLLLQIMTTAILLLAANTAYQDFPRLSSILAADGFMPRQFLNRGDRLVFSNGVLILSALSILLIVAFQADLNRLIQLYLIGVFISFTLSQSGLVLRFRRLKEKGWRYRSVISGVGAFVTGVVLIVITVTKFTGGAWIIMTSIPILMAGMGSIHRHYQDVSTQLGDETRRPVDRRPGNHHVLIYVHRLDSATARAVGYIRSLRTADVRAVTFDRAIAGPWRRVAPEIPLDLLEGEESAGRLLATVRARRADLPDDDFLTVVITEILERDDLLEVVYRPRLHRLKAALVGEPGVQVMDIPILREHLDPSIDEAHEPARNQAVVLVARVHNATLQAIEYAETLRPTELRAVSIGLDPTESEGLGDEWLRSGIPMALEIEASPYRDIGRSIATYVRRFRPDGADRVVTVVIPELVVGPKRLRLLHGQNALIAKRHLLFEPGVVVVSVPYHLHE